MKVAEARILVIDDEPNIVDLLSTSLRFVGFGVLRRLRADGIVCPTLFLTTRDAVEDKITGLTLGGDDYVTKPFSLEEVVARIRAVLRRSGALTDLPRSSRMSFADIELDDDTREVWKAGELVTLSPTEFKLLRYVMTNVGTVLSKPRILDHVWNYDFGGDERGRVLRLLLATQGRHHRTTADPDPARRRLCVAATTYVNARRGVPLRVTLVAALLAPAGSPSSTGKGRPANPQT